LPIKTLWDYFVSDCQKKLRGTDFSDRLLEAIYGVPASKLFAGIFDEARCKVEEHALRALNGDDPVLASFARLILDPARSRPPKSSPPMA